MIPELAETLKAHKARMQKLGYPVDGKDWVFVSRTGKLKAPNSLIKAIEMSEEEANVKTHVTPHQMRYAFSDLLRHAHIDKVTRKAMIGHITDEMQEHYSTVLLDEKREAMQAVAAKLREVQLTVIQGGRGYHPKKGKVAG